MMKLGEGKFRVKPRIPGLSLSRGRRAIQTPQSESGPPPPAHCYPLSSGLSPPTSEAVFQGPTVSTLSFFVKEPRARVTGIGLR